RSTVRCCDTAGRVISKREAIWPAESSPPETSLRMRRRLGSAMARMASSMLRIVSIDLRKTQLTNTAWLASLSHKAKEKEMAELTEKARKLFEGSNLLFVGTVNPDGSPQVTP